jgi:serine phosphatase RsbU (regulator of sigma subunit)
LLRYDYRKNKANSIAPGTLITNLRFNDRDYYPDELVEVPYGNYKLRIDFTGITFRDPDLVTFRYKLEGYDQDWSEPTHSSFAMYPRIEDGSYTFLLQAYNGDGIGSGEPVKIRIEIAAPIWKRWWFILLMVLIAVYGFYLFIKVRERNHRIMEELLKRKLDERTREVIAQKELIELKNKDITDSITYAKRIQEAILPSLNKLRASFPDSFVLYKPRDIVSGDFYYFHQTGRKMYVICADATGHGVPGAFMSLISSTIIKDILAKTGLTGPGDLLYRLDAEIMQVLNQPESEVQTSDGLDISVCEFDLDTNVLKFSSAMRPVIVIRAGESLYIRGSKYSIGGSRYHTVKDFTEEVIELSKGDSVYLFSDGYPDQFGGNRGKKLKIAGVKEIISEIYRRPMTEQGTELQRRLEDWQGDYQQIDDVLFIGIKL